MAEYSEELSPQAARGKDLKDAAAMLQLIETQAMETGTAEGKKGQAHG